MNNFTFQLTRSISQSGNYNGDLGNYGPMSAHSALSAHSPGSPYHNTRASQGSLNLMHSSSRPSLNKVRENWDMMMLRSTIDILYEKGQYHIINV